MRIGIDLGGTKIEIAALDRDNRILHRHRVSSAAGCYEGTIRAIRDLVMGAEQAIGQKASVGIGIPGAISPATGLVKNANSTWLNGHPLDKDLAAALGRPVRVANDANCFALSEAIDGAAKGKSVVFGAIAGTGVGGGIVVGQRVLTGLHAITGEWGHNPLPWPHASELPGPQCFCGKQGCIESFLSGPALSASHRRRTGETLDSSAIAQRAENGDPEAAATMERYFDRFARALATIINVLDPEAVVLGGGVSNIDALYYEIPRRLPPYVYSDECHTPILRNHHGDSSGVRGAAWLWPEEQE